MRNDNSLATILLTSRLLDRLLDGAVKPFKAKEFWELKEELELLKQVGQPQFLLGKAADELIQIGVPQDSATRIAELLDRATAMAFELERLDGSGIRVLTPFDEEYPQTWLKRLSQKRHEIAAASERGEYPQTWLERLSRKAPPVLYAAGALELLNQPGVGVVGSRDVSSEGQEIAKEAAERITSLGMTLVSGGARGVDQLSMNAAFQAGGCVVGILADSLVRKLKKSDVRQAIYEGQTVMCTPYNPDAPFSVGNAMGRNKLIYALSELTLVVACEPEKGGTWSGATEALKKNFGRVAVWQGPGEGTGNAELLELAQQLGKEAIPISSIEALEAAIREPATPEAPDSANSEAVEPDAIDTAIEPEDAADSTSAAEEKQMSLLLS